jgi:hypothetical protein
MVCEDTVPTTTTLFSSLHTGVLLIRHTLGRDATVTSSKPAWYALCKSEIYTARGKSERPLYCIQMSASPDHHTDCYEPRANLVSLNIKTKANAGDETTIVLHIRILVAVVAIVAAKTHNGAVEG